MPNLPSATRCRLCEIRLDPSDSTNDMLRCLCNDCKKHPAAKHLRAVSSTTTSERQFTPADKALIRRVHRYMPASQLLALLNERLPADGGAGFTVEQLRRELQGMPLPTKTGTDWSDMRKHLTQARQAGVLEKITGKTVEDFAVVFALSQAQLLRVKDVIASAKEVSHG